MGYGASAVGGAWSLIVLRDVFLGALPFERLVLNMHKMILCCCVVLTCFSGYAQSSKDGMAHMSSLPLVRKMVAVKEGGSVLSAAQLIVDALDDRLLTVDLLNDQQMEDITTTTNRFGTGGKTVEWPIALSSVLKQAKLSYYESGLMIKAGDKNAIRSQHIEEAEEELANNHNKISMFFSGGVSLYEALIQIAKDAEINMNMDYMESKDKMISAAAGGAASNQVVTANNNNVPQNVGPSTTFATRSNALEWRTVLHQILDPVDYMFIEDEGVVKPMTKVRHAKYIQEKIDKQPLVIKVRRINHADPTAIVGLIKGGGEAAEGENVKKMKLFVHKDAFIRITYKEDEKVLRSNLSAGTATPGEGEVFGAEMSGGSSFQDMKRLKSIIGVVYADVAENIPNIEKHLDMLDVRERQVLIEALILDLSDQMTHQVGVKWGDIKMQYNSQYDPPGNTRTTRSAAQRAASILGLDGNAVPTAEIMQQFDTLVGFFEKLNPQAGESVAFNPNGLVNLQDWSPSANSENFAISPISFDAIIQMVSLDGLSRVLGSPVITVGDHDEALISVINSLPVEYTKVNTDTLSGGTINQQVNTEWKRLNYGYTLWVAPEISKDGDFVRLTVHPQVTEIARVVYASAKSSAPADNEYRDKNYEVASQELETRVSVRSGDALLMGGLTRTKIHSTVHKVPILGDIPFIGRLFRHDGEKKEKTHLVLIIRPTVLDDDNPRTGFEESSLPIIEDLSKGLGKGVDPEMGTNHYDSKEKAFLKKVGGFFSGDESNESKESGDSELPPVETSLIDSQDLTKVNEAGVLADEKK